MRCDERQRVATLGLGYQQSGGAFRVALITRDPAAADPATGRPAAVVRAWKDAALADRLVAFPQLPSLLKALEKAIATHLAAADEAAGVAAKILRATGMPSLELADDVFKLPPEAGARKFVPSKALLPSRPCDGADPASLDHNRPPTRRAAAGAAP